MLLIQQNVLALQALAIRSPFDLLACDGPPGRDASCAVHWRHLQRRHIFALADDRRCCNLTGALYSTSIKPLHLREPSALVSLLVFDISSHGPNPSPQSQSWRAVWPAIRPGSGFPISGPFLPGLVFVREIEFLSGPQRVFRWQRYERAASRSGIDAKYLTLFTITYRSKKAIRDFARYPTPVTRP